MGEEDSPRTKSSDEATEAESEPEGSVFAPVFARYRRNIDAIREFFARLNPVVTDLETGMQEELTTRLDRWFSDFRKHARPEDEKELSELVGWLRGAAEGKPPSSGIQLKSGPAARLFVNLMREVERSVPFGAHRELLNCSILISLVGYFELLVADLVHAFYRLVPEEAANDDKALSVNELRTFGSIDEAMDYVVSRRVDQLLRGTLDDWYKFFDSRLKIDLKGIVPEWARFNEIIQRRHLIVHAGGMVNRRYLANVDWERVAVPDSRPPLGTQLSVDDSYLDRALDIFEIAGLLVCQSVWQKLAPDEAPGRLDSIAGLVDVVYRCVVGSHWYVAEHLAAWGLEDKAAEEDALLIFKFNRWLSIKRQGRWEEIATELESFDCSAKHPRFVVARASLLERADEFFETLPTAGLSVEALKEWPILDEVREDPRFQDAVLKAERNSAAANDAA